MTGRPGIAGAAAGLLGALGPCGARGPPGDIAGDPACVAEAAAAAASFAFISSEILGGATGFSSSSSWITPFASLHTHLPSASSNTKLFSSFKLALGIFFLPAPHILPSTRPNRPVGRLESSPSGVAGVGEAAASFFAEPAEPA